MMTSTMIITLIQDWYDNSVKSVMASLVIAASISMYRHVRTFRNFFSVVSSVVFSVAFFSVSMTWYFNDEYCLVKI